MSSSDNQRITSSFAVRMLQKEIANRKKVDTPPVASAEAAEVIIESSETKEAVPAG